MKSSSKKSTWQKTYSRREFGKMAGALGIAAQTLSGSSFAAGSGGVPPAASAYSSRLSNISQTFMHRDAWSDAFGDCADSLATGGQFPASFETPQVITADIFARGTTFHVAADLKASGGGGDLNYILCAHLDSFDEVIPGANDNASGVAAVLELAKAAASIPNRVHSLTCILFGAEEKQLAGSRHYCQGAFGNMSPSEKQKYRVLNIDTIAGANAESKDFFLQYDPTLGKAIYDGLLDANGGNSPILKLEPVVIPARAGTSKHLSDHISFHLEGVPAISITQFGHDKNVHTTEDTFANLVPDNGFKVVDWVYKYLLSALTTV